MVSSPRTSGRVDTSTCEAAKAPEVMARVEGQGAFGFICFTQLAEGERAVEAIGIRVGAVGAQVGQLLEALGLLGHQATARQGFEVVVAAHSDTTVAAVAPRLMIVSLASRRSTRAKEG